jgi:peptidoglycan/LPS O-acetylase OafA/YrhL
MFFVLSGFLLGGILLNNKNSANYFKTFFLRRIFRIVPIYLLLLIIVFLVCQLNIGKGTSWWFDSKIPFWVYFTYFQNYMMGFQNSLGNNWLAPTWSLGVEEQFYILIAFIIYFSKKRLLLFLLILGVICAPIFRYYSPNVFALTTFTQGRLDSLFGGVLVAIIYQDKSKLYFIKKNISIVNIICIVLLGIVFLASLGKINMPLFMVNTWLSLLYISVLLIVISKENHFIAKLARKNIFMKIGLYSYSIYLFHQVILGLFFFVIAKKLPQINSVLDLILVLICALITFGFSKFVYANFEKKLMALGHQFKY